MKVELGKMLLTNDPPFSTGLMVLVSQGIGYGPEDPIGTVLAGDAVMSHGVVGIRGLSRDQFLALAEWLSQSAANGKAWCDKLSEENGGIVQP